MIDTREMIIDHCFRSWISKDELTFLNSFSDDVIYIESWGPAYRGIAQVAAWFRDWCKENRVLKWDIKTVYPFENTYICEWYFECECDGSVGGFDGVSIVTFNADDKITSLKEFQSKIPYYFPYDARIPSFAT